MSLTLEQLRQTAESVGERSGWDFSRVRDAREPAPWNYAEVVRRYLSPSDRVLDIGTGGGERFLALASYYGEGLGIDINAEMIAQAQRNKVAWGVQGVEFAMVDGSNLPFGEGEFDMVFNRHCSVDAVGVARVLRSGGYFITQQVGQRNSLSVLEAFGWTPDSFGSDWFQSVDELATVFEREGCRVVARAEYDLRYWFLDLESLLFWLKAVPLPEPFDIEKHWHGVNRLLEQHSTPQGIETNEHRELLIVNKR